ncbi:hypothetical protein C8Q75DRAFT_792108 [Abortiporus biennis]|nr:hypothetical protein C8Q75DRAFT_792108 [Abortiporus biennis]
MASISLVLVQFAFFVNAANDWTTPCLSGVCSYTNTKNGTTAGRLDISGSITAISDITTAAGWTILNCDPNVMGQDIRLVCTGGQTQCDHLFQNGATDTLVRLPENCGKMAFARVVKDWVHQDQTLPSDVARRFARRSGRPVVKGLRLDTNFKAANSTTHGKVQLTIQGSSASEGQQVFPDPTKSNSTIQERGFSDLFSGLLDSTSININKNLGTKNFNIDKSSTLLSQSVDCGSVKAGVDITVDAKASGSVNFGLVAMGNVIPPKIDEFALVAALSADLNGTLGVDANLTGSLSTGKKTIFETGLPGLDFPGIFSIGPSVKVDVEATASLTAAVDMNVGLTYTVSNAQLQFPPNGAKTNGSFAPADTNLQLSVAPEFSAKGQVVGHVIPAIVFGIDAFGGIASADVNLNLDTSATLQASFSAGASTGLNRTTGVSNSTTSTNSTTGNVEGCVDLQGGFSVNAGADANFLGLFAPSASVTLFNKTFDIFQRCFTAQGQLRKKEISRYRHRRYPGLPALTKRTLECPISTSSIPIFNLVNGLIAGEE